MDCAKLDAWVATVPMAAMVEAIRSDKAVGRGSCASIDECWEDAELRDALAREGAATPAKAVEWARRQEGLFLDRACDARWGEDDDPQLAWKAEFEGKCRE